MSDARLIASPWERMRGHWSAATWLRTIHVMTGVPIALFAAAALAGLALASIVFVWTVVVPLEPGIHDYAFVVNGGQWVPDPNAPAFEDGFGGLNSRIAVITPDRAEL